MALKIRNGRPEGVDLRQITREQLADIIGQRRSDLALTQVELSRAAGYARPNFISMIESATSIPPLDKCVELADALELDRTWMIEAIMRIRFPEAAKELFG